MKWLAAALGLALLLLQFRLWLSDNGVREVARLDGAVSKQRLENSELLERNRQLAAEVRDLKNGVAALEERARSDLGMIADHETFYQVVPRAPSPMENSVSSDVRTHTAAAPAR